MASFLVTGGAGFIGAALAKRLLDEGHDVIVIDNLSTGYESSVPHGALFFKSDCSDETVYKKLPNVRLDAIFHIAGQSSGEISFTNPLADIQSNTLSTLCLLDYARKVDCKHFVYASSMSVYGIKTDHPVCEHEHCEPESFYGVGKLASENYLRLYNRYGISCKSLRLFNTYGPGQNFKNLKQGMVSIFLAQMLEHGYINVKGSPDRYRDFIYIDDVVDAFLQSIKIIDNKAQVINVGTGVKTTVKDVVETLKNFSNKGIPVEYAGSTEGDVHGIYADVTKMKKFLNVKRYVPIKEGIKRMVAFETKNRLNK